MVNFFDWKKKILRDNILIYTISALIFVLMAYRINETCSSPFTLLILLAGTTLFGTLSLYSYFSLKMFKNTFYFVISNNDLETCKSFLDSMGVEFAIDDRFTSDDMKMIVFFDEADAMMFKMSF